MTIGNEPGTNPPRYHHSRMRSVWPYQGWVLLAVLLVAAAAGFFYHLNTAGLKIATTDQPRAFPLPAGPRANPPAQLR